MPDAPQPIEDVIEDWAQTRLAALAAEAEELAAEYFARAAQARAGRPRSHWGRLGVRVRAVRAERAAPGAFAIEWFTRRWVNRTAGGAKTFTRYLRRGGGDRYPVSAFATVAEPWERVLAEELEGRFGEIRRLARSISRVRMACRLHGKLERALAARRTEGEVDPSR